MLGNMAMTFEIVVVYSDVRIGCEYYQVVWPWMGRYVKDARLGIWHKEA